MRIAFISYHTCPLATLGGKDAGGMNVYVRDLARYLGREGVHLDVYTRSQDEHVPHVLHDLGYGNRVVHIPAGPEHPLSKETLVDYIPEFTEKVLDFTGGKELAYDLIHSHYWLSGQVAGRLKKAWGIPLLQMFHTLGKLKQQIAQNAEEYEGEYRIEGEKEVMQQANRIVASTSTEKNQLEKLYGVPGDKIEIIPPGVDLSRFYPIPPDEAKEYVGIAPNERMILFVGRIEPLKGLDTLLRALAILARSKALDRDCLCLAVIGGEIDEDGTSKNGELDYLMKLRKKFGLLDLVTFLGTKDQDALPYYYSAAEMVIMPSHYESFGMVALESMACGTPVIASHVGGLVHLVEDGVTGYHVPVDDPGVLSERILSLLEDKALRYRMGHDAFALAKKYGWEIITSRMIDLYRQMIEAQA